MPDQSQPTEPSDGESPLLGYICNPGDQPMLSQYCGCSVTSMTDGKEERTSKTQTIQQTPQFSE